MRRSAQDGSASLRAWKSCAAPFRSARSLSLPAVFLSATALYAHVVSMSTGEIRLDGPTAVYELRIPVYEASHAANPETALLDHIRFADGHRTRSSCHEEEGAYICRAEYEFPG